MFFKYFKLCCKCTIDKSRILLPPLQCIVGCAPVEEALPPGSVRPRPRPRQREAGQRLQAAAQVARVAAAAEQCSAGQLKMSTKIRGDIHNEDACYIGFRFLGSLLTI